eukprot:UN09688
MEMFSSDLILAKEKRTNCSSNLQNSQKQWAHIGSYLSRRYFSVSVSFFSFFGFFVLLLRLPLILQLPLLQHQPH